MDYSTVDISVILLFVTIIQVYCLQPVIITEGADKVVCDFEVFDASCPHGSTVHITRAEFGHLHLSKCASFDIGQFGCGADVTSLLDERCGGKRQCQVEMPDTDIYRTRPCKVGLQVFLEVDFVCLKGKAVGNLCRGIPVSRAPSYFTSLAALRSPCATAGNGASVDIQFTTDPGLRIVLTFHDASRGLNNISRSINNAVTITESGTARALNDTSLNNSDTTEYLYTSFGNRLSLGLSASTDYPNIIVSFFATGCLDYRPPAGMWQERSGDNVTVGCYSTDRTWTLQCLGTKWVGTEGNCSVEAAASSTTTTVKAVPGETKTNAEPKLSKGVMLVTILASTALLCSLVIVTACVYVKCLKSKYKPDSAKGQRVQYALSPQDAALLLGNGIQDGAQRNSWHNTMPIPQNNDQHGAARKDYMTMNVLPLS